MAHWSQERWNQPAPAPAGLVGPSLGAGAVLTRADFVFALIQLLADVDADAEGREWLPVPRLDNDLALVDQVRVMVLDLLGAPAAEADLRTAASAIDAATRAL